jgi:hypothetical protein
MFTQTHVFPKSTPDNWNLPDFPFTRFYFGKVKKKKCLGVVPFMFRVCPSDIDISLYMNISESHRELKRKICDSVSLVTEITWHVG